MYSLSSSVSSLVSSSMVVGGFLSRCDERLKTDEGSTHLTYTGLHGGQEHLKIETRLRGERFESVKGECVI